MDLTWWVHITFSLFSGGESCGKLVKCRVVEELPLNSVLGKQTSEANSGEMFSRGTYFLDCNCDHGSVWCLRILDVRT